MLVNRTSLNVILATVIFAAFTPAASAMLHPGLGRFMQRDPLGYGDGASLYQYLQGSPVLLVDPSGNQTTAPATRKVRPGCDHCCCCVDDVKVDNFGPYSHDWLPQPQGDKFDTHIKLSYINDPEGTTGDCTLEWWERTDKPYLNNWNNWEWMDLHKYPRYIEEEHFKNFDNDSVLDTTPILGRTWPCPGTETVTLPDMPSIPRFDLERRDKRLTHNRFLEITIVVKSAPGCQCDNPEKKAYVQQWLVEVLPKNWARH